MDETHFENHKFHVRFDEADVGFIILSAGKTSQQSDWFESDGGYQVMLPGPGEQTTLFECVIVQIVEVLVPQVQERFRS